MLVLQEGRPPDLNAELAEGISEVFEVEHSFIVLGVSLLLLDESSELLVSLVEAALVLLLQLLDLGVNRAWLLRLLALCLHCLDFTEDLAHLFLKHDGYHFVNSFIRSGESDLFQELLEHLDVELGLVCFDVVQVLWVGYHIGVVLCRLQMAGGKLSKDQRHDLLLTLLLLRFGGSRLHLLWVLARRLSTLALTCKWWRHLLMSLWPETHSPLHWSRILLLLVV